jgi:hypothetical protein
MIDDKTFNQVAQLGHFAGGAAIILTIAVISQSRTAVLIGFLVFMAVAAWKEFWYDEKHETAEVRGSSTEDFLVYLAGATAAVLVVLWAS